MSITSELTALNTDIVNARAAVEAKGGTVTTGGGSSQLAADIATIPAGAATDLAKYMYTAGSLFQNAFFEEEDLNLNFQSATSTFNMSRLFNCDSGGSVNDKIKNITISLPVGYNNNLQAFAYYRRNLESVTFNCPNLSPTSIEQAFRGCDSLKSILGTPFDLHSCTDTYNLYLAFDCPLRDISFVANTIPRDLGLSRGYYLTDSSLISIANGLQEEVSFKVTFYSGVKSKLPTIVGTVDTDETSTYHIFTQNDAGDVTLQDFITDIKGWTIA